MYHILSLRSISLRSDLLRDFWSGMQWNYLNKGKLPVKLHYLSRQSLSLLLVAVQLHSFSWKG